MNQTTDLSPDTLRIRALNDLLRKFFLTDGKHQTNGTVMLTSGIRDLNIGDQFKIWKAVQEFDDFTEGNDPHGEHDFGAVTVQGVDGTYHIFWKIDYYAPDMMHGSEDPADPAKTRRVLTIMLAKEY